MTDKRFKHMLNRLGMQFICYDDKEILLGTFADADGIAEIVKILNKQNNELNHIKQTIQETYETERTELGRSVLKQLLEAIE